MADPALLISYFIIKGRNERSNCTRRTFNPTFFPGQEVKKKKMVTRLCQIRLLSRSRCCSTAASKLCRWCRTLRPRTVGCTGRGHCCGDGEGGGILQREKKKKIQYKGSWETRRDYKRNYECCILCCVCCVCACVCVFIKLHITTQSGPVILVILCLCVFFFFGL